MKHKHYHTISDYLADAGLPPPEHPFFTILPIKSEKNVDPNCPDNDFITTTDFYAISLKNIIEGDILYGKTKYDCNSGTLIFLAPNQEFRTQGIKIKAEGQIMLIHADFLKGHALAEQIKNFSFFDYSVNEALHLTPREEALISDLFTNISNEYTSGYDEHSREIILSFVKTLLSYSQRFYKRQFIQRQETSHPIQKQFIQQLEQHYNQKHMTSLPNLSDIAESMHVSKRYISDALKTETGISAKEQIQLFIMDKAKESLLKTNDPITSIAYSLGFDYPQYFVRLFKKKNGITPTEFRNQMH